MSEFHSFNNLKNAFCLLDSSFSNNEKHIFVCLGDLFDRGRENHAVYSYVKGLKHKILIKGNHEDSLLRILTEGKLIPDDFSNETDVTVKELLGNRAIDSNGIIDTSRHKEKIDELLMFITDMRDYYETEGYIFTHGWLPIIIDGRMPRLVEDFRDASESEWIEARLLGWHEVFAAGAVLDGKTIVCGHRPARLGYLFDDTRERDLCEPFFGEGVIAIDAGTVRSGVVNVLVIEL